MYGEATAVIYLIEAPNNTWISSILGHDLCMKGDYMIPPPGQPSAS